MDFRPVGGRKQGADFVRCPVDRLGLAPGRAVKQPDDAPGQILGIGF